MSNGNDGVFISGLDLIETLEFIENKKKRYIAMTLADIEEFIGRNHPNFMSVRKSVLDGYNGYARSMSKSLFGQDIEGLGD